MELKRQKKRTRQKIFIFRRRHQNLREALLLTYEDMHAVLVEKVEEVSLLRLLRRGEHIFWVEEGPDDPHQLHGCTHVWGSD